MSLSEVRIWAAYRKKYGPMSDVRRYDRPAALLGSILSHAHGGKTKMSELMPWGKEEREPSIDDIIGAIGGVTIGR